MGSRGRNASFRKKRERRQLNTPPVENREGTEEFLSELQGFSTFPPVSFKDHLTTKQQLHNN